MPSFGLCVLNNSFVFDNKYRRKQTLQDIGLPEEYDW